MKTEFQKLPAMPDADNYLDKISKEVILNRDFWNSLQLLCDILQPISHRLTLSESDGSICKIVKLWIELEKIFDPSSVSGLFPKDICEFIVKRLDTRWTLFAEGIHCAAFLLDPSQRNEVIGKEDFENGERVIKTYLFILTQLFSYIRSVYRSC